MVTDWNKPVEVFTSQDWKLARILATDLKTPSGEYNVAYAFLDTDGKEYVCLAPKNATYLRNVAPPAPPKKKVWDVIISKATTKKLTLDREPLLYANGKVLSGHDGWTVEKVTEREI